MNPSSPFFTRIGTPLNAEGLNRSSACLCAAAAVSLLLAAILPVLAQAQSINLPPLHVEAPGDSCVDAGAQGTRSLSFDCLNQKLKDAAQEHDSTTPTANAKDVTGTGAPTTVGTFSYTGTSIRMGDAFGKSAIPQRPPAPSFTNALVPSGAK
jgi:hypothetical protein